MTREEVLTKLAQHGAFAGGDAAGLAAMTRGDSPGVIGREAIRAALDGLEGQGLIRFVDPDTWPIYVYGSAEQRARVEGNVR